VSEVVHDRIGEAARRFIDENTSLITSGSSDAVHDVRVALRRSRSYLRTFSRLFDPGLAVGISADLKWYATHLGRVRDIDVMTEQLKSSLEDQCDPSVWKELESVLDERRESGMAALRDCRTVSRYQTVVRHIWMLSDAPMRNRTDLDLRELLKRPWRDYRNALKALPSTYDERRFHEVRIRAKNLRYASEVAEPYQAALAKRVISSGTAVQDSIGTVRDTRAAIRWLEANLDAAPMSLPLVQALKANTVRDGQAVDHEMRKDFQRLSRACRKLRKALD
jgi:CHAD domain-containing protein